MKDEVIFKINKNTFPKNSKGNFWNGVSEDVSISFRTETNRGGYED